jgi:hypothetical protein
MYGRITQTTWYEVAILGPYHANYVVQNSTPPYETLYTRTTSRIREDHICVIKTEELYFQWEYATYSRNTRIMWYKVAILGPYHGNYVVQNSTPIMKRSTRGPHLALMRTTSVL